MSVSRSKRNRRGATIVEGALVLSALMLMLFAILDLGLAVCRYNVLSATARNVARAAIVRGSEAAPELSSWGPAAYSGTAADSSDVATVASPWLSTMSPADVTIQVTWPDGANQADDRVSVQLGYDHHFIGSFLGLGPSIHLQAQSMMRVVH